MNTVIAMTNRTLKPVSVEPAETVTVLVMCKRGSDVWFPERWAWQATEAQTVVDIISGDLTDVACVYELGRKGDITEDIARAVREKLAEDREPVSYRLQGFLHNVLGVTSTHGLNLAA